MGEEYELIREGLIALMCVGDTVNYIISSLNGNAYQIRKCTICNIINSEMIAVYGDYNNMLSIKSIEVHEGRLYSWDMHGRYYHYRGKKRIKKMIEIIESKDTYAYPP